MLRNLRHIRFSAIMPSTDNHSFISYLRGFSIHVKLEKAQKIGVDRSYMRDRYQSVTGGSTVIVAYNICSNFCFLEPTNPIVKSVLIPCENKVQHELNHYLIFNIFAPKKCGISLTKFPKHKLGH